MSEGRLCRSTLPKRWLGLWWTVRPIRTLADDQERFRAVLFLQQKDLNRIVTDWNKSAERIFGYKAAEIVGRSITILIPAEFLNDENVILAKIRAGESCHFGLREVAKILPELVLDDYFLLQFAPPQYSWRTRLGPSRGGTSRIAAPTAVRW
jgi:PAS domain-containing protein